MVNVILGDGIVEDVYVEGGGVKIFVLVDDKKEVKVFIFMDEGVVVEFVVGSGIELLIVINIEKSKEME